MTETMATLKVVMDATRLDISNLALFALEELQPKQTCELKFEVMVKTWAKMNETTQILTMETDAVLRENMKLDTNAKVDRVSIVILEIRSKYQQCLRAFQALTKLQLASIIQ